MYSFLCADVKIMSMKNSDDTIQNRNHDLPACSVVPQSTVCPRKCLVPRGILRSDQLLYNFIVTNYRTRDKSVLIVMDFRGFSTDIYETIVSCVLTSCRHVLPTCCLWACCPRRYTKYENILNPSPGAIPHTPFLNKYE